MTNAVDVTGQPVNPKPEITHKRSVMIYSRYERFWHWTQALLVLLLIFTGFAVHGTHGLISFKPAVMLHTIGAIAITLLWAITIFWQFTTGEWHHYAPRQAGLVDMIKFYAWGILRGDKHPFHKTLNQKQNPLQTMAYLLLMLIIGPLLWVSGALYLSFPMWGPGLASMLGLSTVAMVHTAAAFMMVAFVIGHVYIVTTGETPTAYLKTMVTGYEEIEVTATEEKYLETHHGHIR